MKKLVTLLALGALVMALPALADDAAFKVKGMSCGACEGKVAKALSKVEGVKIKSIDSATGLASVSYDASKVDKAKLVAAIDSSGFKTVGEAATFKVSGMSCGACEGKLSKALAKVAGISGTHACSKSGKATVVFDASKTDSAKIAAAINGTGFKVAN
jgi:P-type Cu+ transporter